MEQRRSSEVLVSVAKVSSGREIAFGDAVFEPLSRRLDDIRSAIVAGARAVGAELETLETNSGWSVSEVAATFGVVLTAEAGVVITKASSQTSFDITVTFSRK